MTRTITVVIADGNNFAVHEGERYIPGLGWDEMLGSIAEMTHPRVGVARYQMLTPEEWQAQADRRAERRAEFDAAASKKDDPLDILRALMTNPHIALADQIYEVREREGQGWDGPAVKAWGDAVTKATEILKQTDQPEKQP